MVDGTIRLLPARNNVGTLLFRSFNALLLNREFREVNPPNGHHIRSGLPALNGLANVH